MIIRINNNNYCIVVPQKSGISTITNIVGYDLISSLYTKDYANFPTKSKVRKVMDNHNRLIYVGDTDDIVFAKENNIKIDFTFGVVREPISRFKSCYRDRVVKKNKDKLKNNSVDFVVNNLQQLIDSGTDFGMHARPQVDWLGKNYEIYDSIIKTKQINLKLKPLISKELGINIPDIRSNKSGHSEIYLNRKNISILKEFYKEDYKLFYSLPL